MQSPAEQMVRLAFGFTISQSLRVVADLGIADRIAAGERDVTKLAEGTSSDARALYRIMRLLAAEGVFHELSPRQFELSELGKTLCSGPGSAADFVRMITREPYQAFARLDHSVQTGMPAFPKVFGKTRFEWLAEHPKDAELFQRAMIALSQDAHEAVADAYDFKPFTKVIDVGGGHGQLLAAILSRYPHLSGVLFDLPAAIQAVKNLGSAPPRTELVAGSFLESVPARGDVYVIKRCIHNWDDEKAAMILRNCRDAMVSEGRVLVVERIIQPGDAPDTTKCIDANMLTVTGGLERSEAEYADLFAQAGLRLARHIPTARGLSVLEACREAA